MPNRCNKCGREFPLDRATANKMERKIELARKKIDEVRTIISEYLDTDNSNIGELLVDMDVCLNAADAESRAALEVLYSISIEVDFECDANVPKGEERF